MDLVQTIRKEGSRGGRANFSWEDVKSDQHRENYLGHSLMAPVGRWQKNRDLNWYANADEQGNEDSEAEARTAEIRKVKEAEEDAMARALGIEPPQRSAGGNANMIDLGERDRRQESETKAQHDAHDRDRSSKKRQSEGPRARHRSRSRDRDRLATTTIVEIRTVMTIEVKAGTSKVTGAAAQGTTVATSTTVTNYGDDHKTPRPAIDAINHTTRMRIITENGIEVGVDVEVDRLAGRATDEPESEL